MRYSEALGCNLSYILKKKIILSYRLERPFPPSCLSFDEEKMHRQELF